MSSKEDIKEIDESYTNVSIIIAKGHYKAATKVINKLYNKSLELNYEEGVFLYYENYIEILFETHQNHLILPFLMHVIKESKKTKIFKLGIFYTKLGIVLSRLFDFDSSFSYLQKGLEVNLNSLPINIDNIIASYIGLIENSYRLKNYKKALNYVNLGFEKLNTKGKYNYNNDYSFFYLTIFKIRVLLKQDKVEEAKKDFLRISNNLSLFSKKDNARYKELELEFSVIENKDYDDILNKAQNILKLAIELENENLRKRILKILKEFHTKNDEHAIAYKYANQLIKLIEIKNSRNTPILYNKNIELPNEIHVEEDEDFEIYLKKDIKIALEYQRNFYNNNYNEKLDVNTLYKPSKIISGDYIGSFSLDKQDNFYLVILADTVGKGIAASYLSFMLDGIIKSIIYNANSFKLTNIINDINSILADTFKEQGFVSLWAGIIDLDKNTLESVNAGHLPAFLLNEKNEIIELDKGTTILGMFPKLPFLESETVHFIPGCSIVAYSDGVTETENSLGGQYEDKFNKLIEQFSNDRSLNFIKYLETDLNLFKDYSLEQDDVSCLVIDYKNINI